MTPIARTAAARMTVCIEQPDWTRELLLVLASAALVVAVMMGALATDLVMPGGSATKSEVAYWRDRALVRETTAAVRLERNGDGYECRHFNVRHEWEAAVQMQCRELGNLLRLGRATP